MFEKGSSWPVYAALATSLLLACLALFVTLHPAAEIQHFLRQWQTLIAGVLAIGAAGWTVSQMQSDDRRAQRRHDETQRLALRHDKLRIDRAANVAVNAFRVWAREFDDVFKYFSARGTTPMTLPDVEGLRDNLHCAYSIASNETIAKARDLFDPELDVLYSSIEDAKTRLVKLIAEKVSPHLITTYDSPSVTVLEPERAENDIRETLDAINVRKATILRFADGLERLAQEYR